MIRMKDFHGFTQGKFAMDSIKTKIHNMCGETISHRNI